MVLEMESALRTHLEVGEGVANARRRSRALSFSHDEEIDGGGERERERGAESGPGRLEEDMI